MKKLVTAVFALVSMFVYSQKKWTLQEAVEYAINNNLQVVNTSLQNKSQKNTLEIANREYLPSVQASIGNTVAFGQGRDVFGNSQRNDNFNNNANVSADMIVYNNGRLKKNIRKTEYELSATQYDLEKAKNDISLQVAQQYLQILLNKEIEKIAISAWENAKKQYERAKITTEVGTTPRTILAEAQAALARENQNKKNAQINTNRSLFSLTQLLRLSDYKNFDVADIQLNNEPEATLQNVDRILETAYQTLPQIKAAENRIKAAEQQTMVSKTALWPTVSAGAGFGSSYFNSLVTNTVGIDINGQPIKESGFFKQYKNNFGQQITVSASIPIFNKGITKLQIEQSKLNEEVAKNILEQQKQDVLQNIQKAQFDVESNYQSYIAARESADSSKMALDFAEKSYAAGKSTIYDLNMARNNFANAQGAVAQAKYNYIFSQKLLNFYAGIPIAL